MRSKQQTTQTVQLEALTTKTTMITYRCTIVTVELSLRQFSIRWVVDRTEPDISIYLLVITLHLTDEIIPRGILNQALVSDDQRLRQFYVRVVRRVLSFNILLAW